MISAEFLQLVKSAKAWIPKSRDCAVYTCVAPPSRTDLAEMLYAVIMTQVITNLPDAEASPYIETAKRLQMWPPTKSFTIIILGNINPVHEIFAKDYRAPPKTCVEEQEMMLVDNADGFWTGLPKAKPVKKVSVNMGMTKEQREAHRLTKLEKQAKDLNQKIADKMV